MELLFVRHLCKLAVSHCHLRTWRPHCIQSPELQKPQQRLKTAAQVIQQSHKNPHVCVADASPGQPERRPSNVRVSALLHQGRRHQVCNRAHQVKKSSKVVRLTDAMTSLCVSGLDSRTWTSSCLVTSSKKFIVCLWVRPTIREKVRRLNACLIQFNQPFYAFM